MHTDKKRSFCSPAEPSTSTLRAPCSGHLGLRWPSRVHGHAQELEINIHSIYAEVLTFAKDFGDVRSFAYIEPNGFEAPRFRSEYLSVKSAEKAIAASTQSDAIFISAKEYEDSIVHQTDMEFWRFNQPQGRELWI
ncbi:hypothetical protein D6D23_06381 [Aureobasidium pullulans]|nr:hypothetical protein D6D23_06381 [Aureobasidium pullulans]